jgi:hypothetical protein
MGSGRWSPATYFDRAEARVRAGADTFAHSAHAKRTGEMRVHQTLDPHGLPIRESRDSDEHPASNAIIISLDVTGSMDRVVRGIHGNLPKLHELLLGHNYIAHPQIMFAAVGDATCDRVPLQVGQFESDNRMDQNLENMILEGGGGGQKTESYELMLYVAARHTAIDCWEKRQHKGYLVMIGDEMAYPCVKRDEIARLIGGGGLQANLTLAEAIAEARQRYHLFFVIPGGAAHGADKDVLAFWRHHLGSQYVIQLDDPEDTSESIALAIGINEGAVKVDDGLDHLQKHGLVSRAIHNVTRALTSMLPGHATTPPDRARRL